MASPLVRGKDCGQRHQQASCCPAYLRRSRSWDNAAAFFLLCRLEESLGFFDAPSCRLRSAGSRSRDLWLARTPERPSGDAVVQAALDVLKDQEQLAPSATVARTPCIFALEVPGPQTVSDCLEELHQMPPAQDIAEAATTKTTTTTTTN